MSAADPQCAAYSLPVRLASAALEAAKAGKYNTAGRLVQRLVNECGGEGVQLALIAWIDTYLDHLGDGQPKQRIRVGAWNGETGAVTTDLAAPELPDRVRWATRLTEARANLDQQRWDELIDDCTDDNFSERMFAVLEGAADTITSVPRGIAVIGLDGWPDDQQ